jgi:hypothetical protein
MRFKLWVDHLYNALGDTFGGKEDDSFGRSIVERVHRYAITLGAGLSLFVVGFLVSLLGGFPLFYLTKPGVYLVCIWVAYSLHSYRYLSQMYHMKSNQMRQCFRVSDSAYQKVAEELAKRAANGKGFLIRSSLVTLLLWIYIAVTTYVPSANSSALGAVFPHFLSRLWTLEPSIMKTAVLDLFSGVCVFVALTALEETSSLIQLLRKFQELPVIPIPGLITMRAEGLLSLSEIGSTLFVFGVVLIEIAYRLAGSGLDVVGVGLVVIAIIQGLSVFVVPRVYVRRLWQRARNALVVVALGSVKTFYPSGELEIPPAQAELLFEVNGLIQSDQIIGSKSVTFTGLVAFAAGQILPFVALVFNASDVHDLLAHIAHLLGQ